MKFTLPGIMSIICILLLPPQGVRAQQVQESRNVSGVWTVEFKGVESDCQEEAENGPKEGEFVFEVEQKGDILSATWKDGKTTNILTGSVSGFMVNVTVYGFYAENCRVVTSITAEITGNGGLIGRYSGRELNCETCTWEGRLTITIAE